MSGGGGLVDKVGASYASLPRAGRWLVWFVLIFLGYFAVIEPALDFRASQRVKAERLIAAVNEEMELTGGESGAEQARVSARQWFGPTLHPTDREMTRAAVDSAINGVLSKHGVEARIAESVDRLRGAAAGGVAAAGGGGGGGGGGNTSLSLVGPGQQVERLVLTLTFDASPEVATAVISDLERSPAIAGLSSVSLVRTGDRVVAPGVVRVVLTVEAWLATRASAGVAAGRTTTLMTNRGVL